VELQNGHMTDRHSVHPYPLRLTPELREELERHAKDAGRSLHAEIIRRIEASIASERHQVDMATAMTDPATRKAAVEGLLDEMIAMAQHRYPGLWVDPKDLKVNSASNKAKAPK